MYRTMNIDDIKISSAFSKTVPRADKMEKCRRHYKEYGFLDRDIEVNSSGVLTDGYIAYLVLKENGIVQTRVVQQGTVPDRRSSSCRRKTTYVFGVHNTNHKEYCWCITKHTKDLGNLRVGNKMIVSTKDGSSVAVVTRVEKYHEPPVNGIIRSVIRCLSE